MVERQSPFFFAQRFASARLMSDNERPEASVFRTREKARAVRWFFGHSTLPFAIEFVLVAPLVLGMHAPGMEPLYLVVGPWVLVAVALLNLPFVAAANRAFRMDRATRRNHALEHATIYYLRLERRQRISGQASPRGFRVCGDLSASQIRGAFEKVRQRVRNGSPIPHISRRCGSNRVTAMGLALMFLFSVTLLVLLIRPPLVARAAALAAAILLFVALRHRVGDWIQARFFMATDFDDARIRDIRRVKPEADERGSVHFVETIVQVSPEPKVDGERPSQVAR
jgi:hypothetical protein